MLNVGILWEATTVHASQGTLAMELTVLVGLSIIILQFEPISKDTPEIRTSL